MTAIDANLVSRTRFLRDQFDRAIVKLAGAAQVDLRIFFTMAHGYITGKIAKYPQLFASPNPLMRLNDAFASTYLKALEGAPHEDWKRAFRVCKAEGDAAFGSFIGLIFLGPVVAESCGACMANVHIKRDLRDALRAVPDVNAQDYGNVLVFVQEANLYAETQLRGRAMGSAAAMVGYAFARKLNLDVKQWRNSVYQECYGKPVPDPSSAFCAEYRKLEGRGP
jgi:hypothetical protein